MIVALRAQMADLVQGRRRVVPLLNTRLRLLKTCGGRHEFTVYVNRALILTSMLLIKMLGVTDILSSQVLHVTFAKPNVLNGLIVLQLLG